MATQVLVTGAGGFIGTHLIPALCRAGYDVICGGRDAASLRRQFPSCRVVECDFAKPNTSELWDSILRSVTVVINAVGIIREQGANTFAALHRDAPIALFRAAERNGVRRVIHISALGADAGAETRYHQSKQAADEALRGLSLEWVILQPSLVYGPGSRSQAFFAALAALPVPPILKPGDQQIQPVHVDDLIEGIVQLVHPGAASRVTLPVVGPAPVTFREYLEMMRQWLGLTSGPTLTVPIGLVRLAAQMGDVVRSEFVTSETLAMLSRGNTADPTPFAHATGVEPRSLSTGLPAAGAGRPEYVAASLYFLWPLLRVSIAAVWIGSGMVSLFFYPREMSEGWLVRAGVPDAWTGQVLAAASGLDIGLGLATLLRWRLPQVLTLQLLLIIGFSFILTVRMPELWAHPFGPLLKNLPLFAGTLMLWALERQR